MTRFLPFWFFILLVVVLLLGQVLHEPLFSRCYLDSTRIYDGEIWRLWSAYLVHSNWPHLWLNLGGVLVLGVVWRGLWSQQTWFLLTLYLMSSVSLIYLIRHPAGTLYFGFSAVSYGLIVAALVTSLPKHYVVNSVVLVVIVWRLFDQLHVSGSTDALAQWIGAPVAVMSHWYGATAGLLWGSAALMVRTGMVWTRTAR